MPDEIQEARRRERAALLDQLMASLAQTLQAIKDMLDLSNGH